MGCIAFFVKTRGWRAVGLSLLAWLAVGPGASRALAAEPTSVTLAGSLQSELGCAGDWDPACAATHLAFDSDDQAWQGTFSVPAGMWEYLLALDDSWGESYPAANVALSLGATTSVKFYYSNSTHWVVDSVTGVIAVAPGSFQSELGCSGDWDPTCLRSWLQDPDGDDTFTFVTTALPAGGYEAKVAHNESWVENYGSGGAPGGDNIAFTVPTSFEPVLFSYDLASHILTISPGLPVELQTFTVE